jgi:hypothetical protein
MTLPARFGRIALLLMMLPLGHGVAAQQAPPQASALPMVYVGKFVPVEQAPAGFGPLHAINADMHSLKAEGKASQLSSQLVDALKARGAQAALLPADAAARPGAGWLVEGVYYALDQNSRLVSLPRASRQGTPNVEVSVKVTDLSKGGAPFAVLGTDSVMKGQGVPVGWNPYVIAAKFVYHQIQGQDSIASLADQIAQEILAQGVNLRAHVPGAEAP